MSLMGWNQKIFFVTMLVLGLIIPGFRAIEYQAKDVNHFNQAYPDPPCYFKGNQIAVLVFKTTPEALQKLVPQPLMPLPANLIFIYFSKLTLVYGSVIYPYHEIGICVPVIYQGMGANFYSIMYLDKTMAITGGREIWGFPKKEGDITFTIEGNKIIGTLERLGTRLINFNFFIKEKLSPDTPQPNFPSYCFKIIPSIEKGAPPDVKQITAAVIRDQKVHELYKGIGSVEFKSGKFDPLDEIPVLEIVSGTYTVSDMVLDYGKVIFDYLKDPESNFYN